MNEKWSIIFKCKNYKELIEKDTNKAAKIKEKENIHIWIGTHIKDKEK